MPCRRLYLSGHNESRFALDARAWAQNENLQHLDDQDLHFQHSRMNVNKRNKNWTERETLREAPSYAPKSSAALSEHVSIAGLATVKELTECHAVSKVI